METPRGALAEGEDYTLENGLMVFTAAFHLKRGWCCGSGCRHCPFPAGPGTSAGNGEASAREAQGPRTPPDDDSGGRRS